ncbi:MAG: Sir2 family NAD-dependent protein deacetylase [Lachnospiraceae bacterium]
MLEQNLQRMLEQSKYTVVLSGYGMLLESGYPALRDGEESYDIELKYGYSTEEIFSSAFFATRKEIFYDFYRNEMLSPLEKPPGICFYELAKMQEKGWVQTIVTRRIFGLPERAGCKNIIELHGNVYHNFCPHCGKEYPMEYIRDSKKIPLCDVCGMPVRPRVCLFGEMVDNDVMTKAAAEIAKADVLLILGSNLKTYLCEQLLGYYRGTKLILITKNEHYSDKYADIVVHSRVDDALKKILSFEKK